MPTETKTPLFKPAEIAAIRQKALPAHVAIIMDGNRRWARKNAFSELKSTFEGHNSGAMALLQIIKAAVEIGIKTLTVYGFSTENRGRSAHEVETVYHIIERYLKDNRQLMKEEGVKFSTIGDFNTLPSTLKEEVELARRQTQEGKNLEVILALNYGARDEITRAFRRIADQIIEGAVKKEAISEELIGQFLDTSGRVDPDLLIRTSGEMRLSNFLLWQLAYAEIYLTDTLWPDFSAHHFYKAISDFQARERRIGR